MDASPLAQPPAFDEPSSQTFDWEGITVTEDDG
jgi:hypothetical protein